MTINKTDLISGVAEKAQVSKKVATDAVNALFDTIKETLANGDSVQVIGFGSFEVRERPAREGINPRTMEKVAIPASKNPVFKAGKQLKTEVNK